MKLLAYTTISLLLISLSCAQTEDENDVEGKEICEDDNCSTNCNGGDCSYCHSGSCCESVNCNNCVNDCRTGCTSSPCVTNCFNTCVSTPCVNRVKYRSCGRRNSGCQTGCQKLNVNKQSVQNTTNNVDITTNLNITNEINNVNKIDIPVEVKNENYNNVNINLDTRNTYNGSQACCTIPQPAKCEETETETKCEKVTMKVCDERCQQPQYKYIPYPVPRPYPVQVVVPRPYPVIQPRPVPVPYPVERPVPYPVERPVPYPIARPVPMQMPQPVPIYPSPCQLNAQPCQQELPCPYTNTCY